MEFLFQEIFRTFIHTEIQWLQFARAIRGNCYILNAVFFQNVEKRLRNLTPKAVENTERLLGDWEIPFIPNIIDEWNYDLFDVINHSFFIRPMVFWMGNLKCVGNSKFWMALSRFS